MSDSSYLKATPQQEVRQPSLDAWQQRHRKSQTVPVLLWLLQVAQSNSL